MKGEIVFETNAATGEEIVSEAWIVVTEDGHMYGGNSRDKVINAICKLSAAVEWLKEQSERMKEK